ncbi:hypothetical protein EN784_48915 [bacterium M00.F.Ca.ET.141.01.1.1]|nr:hypothetical protein EN784_48915 [bacterium M00.F.Ca.ET.141.01.1.1]
MRSVGEAVFSASCAKSIAPAQTRPGAGGPEICLDPGATNSPTITPGDMNSNADQNCPTNPQGARTDANGNATAPTVNDKNCGK